MLWGIFNVLLNGVYPGCIVFDGAKIFGAYTIGQLPPQNVEWYDGGGLEIYPAMINLHVHSRPDEPHKEDVDHLLAACHEGGIGTIGTMPNTLKGFKWYDELEGFKNMWKGRNLRVIHHIGAATDNIHHLRTLHRNACDEALGEVKMWMEPSTNPSLLIHEPRMQRAVLQANAEAGRVTLVHVGVYDMLKKSEVRFAGQELTHLHHCIIRHPFMEIEGARMILEANREVGGDLHICHASTRKTLRLVLDAKNRGQRVTCESDPKYMFLNAGKLATEGSRGQVNPSLRTSIEAAEMEKAVCAGEVDCIFDDHAPHRKPRLQDVKKDDLPYPKSPSGLTGVQTTFQLIYELKRQGKINAARFVDITSRKAAQKFHLNKGELKPGFDADIVLIDPNGSTTFSDETTKSKAGWTPYHGWTVRSTIPVVILRGEFVKGSLQKIAR